VQKVESDGCIPTAEVPTGGGGGDVVQLPRLRRHSQSMTTLRSRRTRRLVALTRAMTSRPKWRFSLIVSPPSTVAAPATAPAVPSASLPSLHAGDAQERPSPGPNRSDVVVGFYLFTLIYNDLFVNYGKLDDTCRREQSAKCLSERTRDKSV